MRTIRALLVVAGLALAGYGGWLVWPQLEPAAGWLVAGPVLHDALVAPLVGLVGLALARLVRDRIWRRWIGAGLVVTATLLLIAVPLVWRPSPAPPNPGLQDRDYAIGLAIWLAALWIGVLAGGALNRRRAAQGSHTE
jgi:hypothetical protein